MLYYRTLIIGVTQDFVCRRVIRRAVAGLFVGLVGWLAARQLRRRSTSHEQEVKENVLARPAADARESSLSLSLSLSFSLTASSTSLPLSPHWRLVRFVTLLARSIPVSIPLSTHHVSSTDPSSARSPDYTRLCNVHPTILYRLYRKLSSRLTRAWLPTRTSCIPIYSGAWIEERDCVRKPRRIDLVRLTMIR